MKRKPAIILAALLVAAIPYQILSLYRRFSGREPLMYNGFKGKMSATSNMERDENN